MKKIALLLLFVLVSCGDTHERFKGENGKYGYKNKEGRAITEPKYDDEPYWDFREGYARVNINEQYGFINEQGVEVIPLMYDYAELFCNDLSVVVLQGKRGVINRQNQLVIPIEYDEISNDRKDRLKVKLNGKWGIVNYANQVIVPIAYDYIGNLSEDLIAVTIDKKHGYVDHHGRVVVPLMYDDISYFADTLAVAELNHKCGYINKKGEVIIPIEYECGIYHSGIDDGICVGEGLFPVKRNEKFGFVNRYNELVIPFEYDDTYGFAEGVAVVSQNGQWGFINHQNEVVIPFAYSFASNFEAGKATVWIGDKYGSIDKQGNFSRDYSSIIFMSILFGVPLLLVGLVVSFVIKRNKKIKKSERESLSFNTAQIVNLCSLSVWVFALFSIPAGYEMGALAYVFFFVFFGVVQLIATIVLIRCKVRPVFFYILAALAVMGGMFFILTF